MANKNLINIRKQRKLLEKIPMGAITEDARKRKADELDKQEALVFDLFNKAYRKSERQTNK